MSSRILARILGLLGMFALTSGCRPDAGTGTLPEAPVSGSLTSSAPETPLTRIMPLGDSITQADAEHDSYRRPLFQSLESEGYLVDFVGTQRSNHRGGPPHPDFDLDHEGHWGFRVDQVLTEVRDWVARTEPDVLLVHLGSNDLFREQGVESTAAELAELIDAVREVRQEAAFLVARIIPTQWAQANRIIRELNERIQELERKSTATSPVIVVDQFDGFEAASMTYDGVHPNASGEIHMSDRWLEALRDLLP